MARELHHFVPRFYLQRFVNQKRGGVWVCERENDDSKWLRVDAIAARNNYYTVELTSGATTNALETFFSSLEGLASPIVAKLVETSLAGLSEEEHGAFSYFLAFGHLRIPNFRDELEGMMREFLSEFSRRIATDHAFFTQAAKQLADTVGERLEDHEELREGILSGQIYPVVNPEFSIVQMMEHAEFVAEMISRMRWTVRQDPAKELVTSDNPVVFNNPSMLGDSIPTPRELEVIFPLSPSHIFIATWDGHAGEGTMRLALARDMNKIMALAAGKYVYSSTSIPAMAKYLNMPRKQVLDIERFKRSVFNHG
ncbi:MAG: DUF4238 domain-containing protein [Acidobacteriota bacterium]|jgi:hypothetical protein